MYNTSAEYKNRVYEASTKHLLNIYIDGNKINPDYIFDFNINSELFSNNEFSFGSVTSLSVEFKIYKNALPSSYNTIYVESGIDSEIIPLGYFTVEDIKKENEATYTIKATDYMMKFEFNYDGSNLNYPATMLQVLQDICNKAGVELGSTSFLNMNKQIAVYDNNVSAREYLSYISEQAGGFATIGRDGKLYIKQIGEDTVEYNINYFKEFSWGKKFKISRIAYEDGVQNYKIGDETNNTVWINSNNMYIVDQEQIENVYNSCRDFECYSFEGTSIIDPALDVGDILIIDGKKIIYQGSLQYQSKFIANIKSQIQSKEKEETTRTTISNKTKFRRAQSEINQIEGKIEQIVGEQDSFSKKLSSTTMKVNEVETKVLGIYDFTKLVKGNNQIILEDALDTNILDLKIYAETIKGLYPKKTLFPSKNLFSSKGGSAITVVVSKVSKGTEFPLIFPKSSLFPKPTLRARSNPAIKKEYKINLPKPLLSYGSTQDLLEIYYDENIGMCVAKTVRYLKKVGNNIVILSKPEEEIITYLNLKLNKGKNYIYLKNIYNWKLEANYIFNTELNKYYATKVESYTKIKETEDTINLEVSKKVNNDEIISAINLSPEKIEIKAGKIDFNGAVSANENFKILEDGSMEAKNGKFSGDIYLGNGGKVLGGNGLYTNLQFNSTSISTSSSQGFGGFTYTGFQADEMNNKIAKVPTCIDAYIPEVFTISSAYITISHIPLDVVTSSGSAGKGNVKNIKIYSSNVENINSITWNILSSYIPPDIASGTEIPNSFEGANNSYTPKNNGSSVMLSKDISSSIKKGSNRILIQSSNSAPTYSSDYNTNAKNCALQSGFIFAQLNVFGYIKTKESE